MIKAITWFFDNEPEGIILEEGCLPSDDFWGFCSALLEKFRNDDRVGHITGSNRQGGVVRGNGSYYFSLLTHVGGWAGWRRIWKDYDPDMTTLSNFKELGCIDNMPSHTPFKPIWLANLTNNYLDSWDYQYCYLNMTNSRMSIVPNRNLVITVGDIDTNSPHYALNYSLVEKQLEELDEIVHPSFMISNINADVYSQHLEYDLVKGNTNDSESYKFLKKKISDLAYRADSLHKIPKIIHQIYEDPAGPTEMLLELAASWKEHHPDWEYRFWGKAAIEEFMMEFFPGLIRTYNEFKYPVQRWDAIRYLILYQMGGLYIDLDYECIESIEPLLINTSCCLGLEPSSNAVRFNKSLIIGNAFMASIPGHGYFRNVIDEVFCRGSQFVNLVRGTEIMESTGPFMMTRVFDNFERKEDVTLIPADLVTPLTYTEVQMLIHGLETQEIENKVEKAYAIHYFFGSWWKNH
jgi:mannosyltransferase OCH1-like enzyme